VFCFTIRDVLWLMVVVAMALGWFSSESARQKTRMHAERLRDSLRFAKDQYEAAREPGEFFLFRGRTAEWELIDQPIQ
jgi:hypothetical protein